MSTKFIVFPFHPLMAAAPSHSWYRWNMSFLCLCHSFEKFILLTFSVSNFLSHWFFSVVFLVIDSSSFLFPSFCLPWIYFALLFQVSWERKLGYDLRSFFPSHVTTINFPVSITFAMAHIFCYVVLLFSLSSMYFLNFSWDFLFVPQII